jgi:outer membrane protein OmpA-like peptidoglycan-associated protein
MENNSNRSHFWPSYVDLMTSLFVIMLVLFVLSYLNFNRIETELRPNAEQMERIRQIDSALKKLDRRYFRLDPVNNRYQLMIDVNFAPNSADIRTLRADQLRQLREAGKTLFGKMQGLSKDPNINYILVVEGHAEIVLWHGKANSELDPNRGYQLSYSRALALKNFWQQNGYGFNGLHNCEILIVGSGYFGKSRDKIERNNRRFSIQIAPKFKI